MQRALGALSEKDVLGFHLQLYKSQKHYEAAAKFEECAAASRGTCRE